MVEGGLRERKKAATRQALAEAALSITLEHGIEATTTVAIAEAAGVSARTFHNYFDTREDALCYLAQTYCMQLCDAMDARDPRESAWDALIATAVLAVESSDGISRSLGIFQVASSMPIIKKGGQSLLESIYARYSESVASRDKLDELGMDPALQQLYCRTLVQAFFSMARSTVETWLSIPRASGHSLPFAGRAEDQGSEQSSGHPAESSGGGKWAGSFDFTASLEQAQSHYFSGDDKYQLTKLLETSGAVWSVQPREFIFVYNDRQ